MDPRLKIVEAHLREFTPFEDYESSAALGREEYDEDMGRLAGSIVKALDAFDQSRAERALAIAKAGLAQWDDPKCINSAVAVDTALRSIVDALTSAPAAESGKEEPTEAERLLDEAELITGTLCESMLRLGQCLDRLRGEQLKGGG